MDLKEGDWVLLKFDKARLHKMPGKESATPKIANKYYGPFKVVEKINGISACLARSLEDPQCFPYEFASQQVCGS